MNKILEYLGQQSTWKGLIAVAGALGVTLSPELTAEIIATALGAVGIINVIRNEKKPDA